MRRPPLNRRLLIIPAIAATAVAPTAAIAHSTETTAAKTPSSKIVLGKSVGGITLGMTTAQVKQRLGKPSVNTKLGGSTVLVYLSAGLTITTTHGKADAVGAMKPRFRTSKGIHVGSTRSAVKRAYPHARCKTVKLGPAKSVDCTMRSGSGLTDFSTNVKSGRVETIIVSAS